jgi:hypothetical protein
VRSAYLIVALTGSLLLGVSGAMGHTPGAILYGGGTATIDGALAAGEWAGARRIEFGARLPPHDGGGTVPGTLWLMNDSSTLYVALQVGRATFGGNTSLALYFDNDHDGTREAGDDAFLADIGTFSPVRFVDWHWASCVPGGAGLACPVLDTDRGGTSDGTSAAEIAGGAAVLEAAHPLDSVDDGHDFSLGPGSVAGFAALITLFSVDTSCNFGPSCSANTNLPIGIPDHGQTSSYGNLVVSPDSIPPETSVAGGPAEGATTNVRDAAFVLSAADNLTPEESLALSCSLDGAVFSSCGPRPVFGALSDGPHRLEARATDELGNVDPTPAARQWIVDATPPETSITAGPTEASRTKRRDAIFALAGSDNLTPSNQLAFSCSLDGRAFSKCEAQTVFDRLGDGRHRLEARASDVAGNVDQSPVSRQWSVDGTSPSRPRARVRVRGLFARVKLSAIDAQGGSVRYRCSVDGKRYRACAASTRFRLRRGKHHLRAVALDSLGNQSAPRIAHFRVGAGRR